MATSAPVSSTSASGEVREDGFQVLRACDVVLGSILVALAAFITFAAFAGKATATSAVLMWCLPLANVGWSAVSKRWSRAVAESLRNVFSLPLATLLYMTPQGYCHRFWLTSAVMVVGQGVLWGAETRRARAGQLITVGYASAVLVGGYLAFGTPLWASASDAAGILMTGLVISFVASHLGRSLEEARRRRDEAEGHKGRLESALYELTSAREQLAAVVECAPVSILAVDCNGKIQFTNWMAPGMEKASAIGTNVLEYVIPEARDLFTSRMKTVLETGSPQTLELHGRAADGGEIWYACHLGAMKGGDAVIGVVVIWQNVTELKRTQVEFVSSQRLAAVGTLAAGIAHEINTPVQFVNDSTIFLRDAVRDLFDVIKKLQEVRHLAERAPATPELSAALIAATESQASADLPYLLENVPAACERCVDGLQRIATIVRSMKEFAHPSQRDMAAVDLNRAIQNTLVIARNEYKYVADVETAFGDLPPVNCFVNDINQVVLNLVVNAAHAVSDAVKGTSRRGSIAIETRLDGEDVVISIRDTGTGIPAAIRARIFDPFFTTKEVGKGTGQGLALVWRVIKEKHGGDITVDSTVGEGTTFRVRLPVAGRSENPTDAVSPTSPADSLSGRTFSDRGPTNAEPLPGL
jgi:PAS domain S-box-containing protein